MQAILHSETEISFRHGESFISLSNRTPIYAMCRRLVAHGFSGPLEVTWEDGRPSCRVDIEKGSRLTVAQRDRDGFKLEAYQTSPYAKKPAPGSTTGEETTI